MKELLWQQKQLIAAATLSAPFFSIISWNFYDALGAAIAPPLTLYVDKYIRIPFCDTAFARPCLWTASLYLDSIFRFNSTDDLIVQGFLSYLYCQCARPTLCVTVADQLHINSGMSKLFESSSSLLLSQCRHFCCPPLLWNKPMTILTFLLQAVASLLAIIAPLARSKCPLQYADLVEYWYGYLAIYLCSKGPTNVISNLCGCYALVPARQPNSQHIIYKTPAVVFILAILPLVPGYISYRTTAFFVTGDYSQAMFTLLWWSHSGAQSSQLKKLASGTVVLKLITI